MKKTNSLKAIALSLGLAAMMAPATLNAQVINRGLLDNPYKTQDNSHRNSGVLMRGNAIPISEGGEGFSNETFDQNAPLGSGIVILIGASLGYVALKKKEDEQ